MRFDIKEKIERIVGKPNISDSSLDMMSYSTDASQKEGHPLFVVWPKNSEQVKLIIKTTINNSYDIVPRGAGTGLVGGCTPEQSIVMDMTRMNSIIKINPKKKTAIVEPGVTIKRLNHELKRHNLSFPIRPASYKIATIGGMIATNAGGMNAIRYGKTKNWVNQIEIMTGENKTYNTSNIKPFCGSEGIFGIITQATLDLTDITEEHSYYHFTFDTVKDMLKVIEEYRYNRNILSIEYIDRTASRLMKKDNRYHLIIEVSDTTGKIKDKIEIKELEEFREGVGAVLGKERFIISEDPWIPPKSQERFLDWLDMMRIPSFGHKGYGIIHPRFRENHQKKIKRMFALVKKIDGKISGEHGIGLMKKEYLSEDEKRKIKKLKKRYDPKNIFNRNKIIDF